MRTMGSQPTAKAIINVDNVRVADGDPLLGDIDGDGVADAGDYLILKQNFGTTGSATPAMGDIADGTGAAGTNGAVDFYDLQLLARQINAASGAVRAPEPAAFGLLALGGLAVLRRKGR